MKFELLELTKKTILKYISEEDIFERYLGFKVEFHEGFCNPLRIDKSPDCFFYYREGTNKVIFHDIAAGFQWDCFDVVMYDFNCNFPKALEKIANDFGLLDTKLVLTKQLPKALPKNKVANRLQIQRKKYTTEELAYWNIGGLELTEQDLTDNKIFSISHLWEHTPYKTNEYYSLKMVFAYHFTGYNYQIYFPLKKKEKNDRRFINPQGIKTGDLEFIDFKQSYLCITKSKKDCFYLRYLGVNACFIINEAVKVDEKLLEVMNQFEHVFTLFDNDKWGLRASARFRRNYSTIPLKYEKSEGKDTTEVLKKFGKQYMLDLIEYYKTLFDL